MTLTAHTGNHRWCFLPEQNHYALEVAQGGEHRSWRSLVYGRTPQELLTRLQQHYTGLKARNPQRFEAIISPVRDYL